MRELCVYLKPDEPNFLFVTEDSLINIEAYEAEDIFLLAWIQVYDPQKAKSAMKKLGKQKAFGHINVLINNYFEFLLFQNYNYMAQVYEQFSLSKSINFRYILNSFKDNGEEISIKIDFKECSFKAIQIININAKQKVYFSVKSLENVRKLDIGISEKEPLNLQFEDLSIPYPNTQFSLYVYNSKNSIVQKAYSKYPDLFDTQFCNIHLHCYGQTNSLVPQNIEKQFPKCPLGFSLSHSLEVNKDIINYLCKSQQIVRDIEYFEQCQFKLVDTLRTKKLELKTVFSLSIEQLSKFKITEEIMLMHIMDPEIIMSESKCECPPKMKVDYSFGEGKINKQITEILNGFCKYENVQIFSLKMQFENDYNYIDLWRKLEQLINIKQLNFSIPANAWTKDMLKLLTSFKKLAKLQLKEMKSNEIVMTEKVAEISQFVIDNMKGLRKLKFNLQHAPVLDCLLYKHRPQPLTIIYKANYQIHFVIDIRIGIKTLNIKCAQV